MRNAVFLILLGFLAQPAHAQMAKPLLAPAPCSDPHNCPNYKRGAALPAPGASQIQNTTCPAGTVFNPKRGTCKVLGAP
jgi:hypothetical protein